MTRRKNWNVHLIKLRFNLVWFFFSSGRRHFCKIARILAEWFPESIAMTSEEGWTALLYAAKHGNDGVVDVRIPRTCFCWFREKLVINRNHFISPQVLLDCGADINAVDLDGSTALHQ